MSTEISTSQAFVKERTEKTRAAQQTLANDVAWTWPLKSIPLWDADLTSLDGSVTGSLTKITHAQEVDMLAARGILDGRLDAIHKYTLLTVGVMRVRAKSIPGLIEIVDDLRARGDSRRAIEEEADDLIAAWEEWDQQIFPATFSPAPGKSLADFKLLVEGGSGSGQSTNPMVATLKKNYKTALAKWRRSSGLLNVLYARLEDECVSWYAEATRVFPEGTAEGDMIRSQIPTIYNPPTPAPPTPPAPPPP